MGGQEPGTREALISIQLLLAEAQKLAGERNFDLLAYVISVAALECEDQLSVLPSPDGVEP